MLRTADCRPPLVGPGADPRRGALSDRNHVEYVDQDVDDGQRRCQRSADPEDPPNVPHDVGIFLGGPSCQQSLTAGPARPLDLRCSSPFARPCPAGLRHPLLGDYLGLDLSGSGLFLGR